MTIFEVLEPHFELHFCSNYEIRVYVIAIYIYVGFKITMELQYALILQFIAKLQCCALLKLRTVIFIINVMSVNDMSITSDSETVDDHPRIYLITMQLVIIYCNPKRV